MLLSGCVAFTGLEDGGWFDLSSFSSTELSILLSTLINFFCCLQINFWLILEIKNQAGYIYVQLIFFFNSLQCLQRVSWIIKFLILKYPYVFALQFDLVLISNCNFLLWLHKKNFLHDFWDSVVGQEALLHTYTTANHTGLATLSHTIADNTGLVTLCDRRVWRFAGGAWRGSYFSGGQWRGRNLASAGRTKSLQKTQNTQIQLIISSYILQHRTIFIESKVQHNEICFVLIFYFQATKI